METALSARTDWRIAASRGLAHRSWSDELEAVVYDCATGRTHRVDDISHALLVAVEEEPRSIEVLVDHFDDWFEDGMDRRARECYLAEALRHLQAVDLVTPVR